MAPARTRWLWLLLAYASLANGIVAIAIPGIPSTGFILLAAWAATRSSPRLAAWLERHRLFGPMIRNWRHGRVVAPRQAGGHVRHERVPAGDAVDRAASVGGGAGGVRRHCAYNHR